LEENISFGVDGGSTTTKACLIDIETNEITASFYGRTHGDPVVALKNCLVEMKKQIKEDTGNDKVSITLAATTGSRESFSPYFETPVYIMRSSLMPSAPIL